MSPPSPRTQSYASISDLEAAALNVTLNNPRLKDDLELIRAVNELANLKIQIAVVKGHLRVVNAPPRPREQPLFWMPRMDIFDYSATTMGAVVEVPGLRTDEVQISREKEEIIISGERKPMYQDASSASPVDYSSAHTADLAMDPSNFHEIRYGRFQRRIKVPKGTRGRDIGVTQEFGILLLTWPKSPISNDSDTCVKLESSPSLNARGINTSRQPYMLRALPS